MCIVHFFNTFEVIYLHIQCKFKYLIYCIVEIIYIYIFMWTHAIKYTLYNIYNLFCVLKPSRVVARYT